MGGARYWTWMGSVKVDVVANEVLQYGFDIQILDNPTPTFVQVAEKVVLCSSSLGHEFERRLLTCICSGRPTQRQMLAYL